jgi:Na+/H+-dicarboxylate symporter
MTDATEPQPAPDPPTSFELLYRWWHGTPLYLRILGACLLGAAIGVGLRELNSLVQAAEPDSWLSKLTPLTWASALAIPSRLVLRLLGALAAPLVLIAVVQALMQAQIPKGSALKLLSLLLLNTVVAILIGLAVVNLVQPGKWTSLAQEKSRDPSGQALTADPLAQFLDNVPKSLLGPFTDDGKITSVILIALAIGIALRKLPGERLRTAVELVALLFDVLVTMLHWIIEVIPLAVLGIVANIVATKGFGAFINLGAFAGAVVLALLLQATYYLVRIRFGSWVRPLDCLRGMRDALVMAFSTASSTVTMPLTYACLREKVGLRERSASLGALVGANFNNDGTALYQAMAALFVAQISGIELSLMDQFLVVVTAIAASVGAAGIPEAGTVTMTLIFKALHLDLSYIPVLLTIDWLLDRCRTTINILGDVNVSCLLDGYTREERTPTEQDRALAEIA